MATTSKGKAAAVRGKDWRYRIDYEEGQQPLTTEEAARVVLPFQLTPEPTNEIPSKYT
jgi:hypothetical protein